MKNIKLSAKERILDAATLVVGETGAGHLTLDRVAALAGVSKGGLLYHFNNKQSLIEEMIAQFLSKYQDRIDLKMQHSDENESNKLLKAMIEILGERTEMEKRQLSALLAAAAENPELLIPAREFIKNHFEQVKKHAGASNAVLTIFLAVQGIQFMDLFDLSPLSKTELDNMVSTFWKMTNEVSQ